MTPVICFAVLIVAVALTWLYAKAILTKGLTPASEHNALQQQYAQLKTDEGILKALFNDACKQRDDMDAKAASLQAALTGSSNELVASQAEQAAARQYHAAALQRLATTEASLQTGQQALLNAEKMIAALDADNKAKTEILAAQKAFTENIKAEMEREFRLIANTSLDENSRKTDARQKEKLITTLEPFREQIEAFRKQVDEKFTAEVADRNTLKGELSKVFALANNLTDQTNKLTNALTLQTKTQGNYGEAILETILTNAGMIEGEHYEKQFNTTNAAGQRVIPDIVLHSPNNYSVVIDSKVSLVHYMRYCSDVLTPAEEKSLRRDIWQSFKNHIDGLSGKRYETIAHCADFVLMFAPVESAFSVAAQHDSSIRNYAFDRKVFLVTPSNLLLVVKMIGDLWQKDRVNKEAHAMADRAKMLYEKACAFLDSFVAVGAALDKAKGEWDAATSRLTGNGGLVSQGKMLQKLVGQKSGKTIPATLLTEPTIASGVELPDTAATV